MKHGKRVLAMVLAGVLAVGCVAGCGSKSGETAAVPGSGGQADGGKTITVITKALNTDYWHMVQAGAILAGEEYGYEIKILGPNDEANSQEEMNQILEAQNDSDALVIAPNDPNVLVSTIADAHSAGLPIVIIDSNLSDKSAYDAFTGTNNYEAGKGIGEYVGQNQKGAVAAIITGLSGSYTHEQRASGIIDGLEAAGCTVMDKQPADSDRAKAVTVAGNLIQANPELTALVATSDEMALGAYEAVEAAGLTDTIKVYGFDASIGGLESIMAGELTADAAQLPIQMGYDGVALAVKLLNGEPVEQLNETPFDIVTKKNAQEFYDSVMAGLEKTGY